MCKLDKPAEEFSGTGGYCRPCNREYQKAHYKPEQQKTAHRLHAKQVKTEVYDHYGRVCNCCGSQVNLSIDHIIPIGGNRGDLRGYNLHVRIKGEGFPKDKYQVLCRTCNRSKGTGEHCKIHPTKP